jgi:hypothetical protein
MCHLFADVVDRTVIEEKPYRLEVDLPELQERATQKLNRFT